MVWLTIIGIQMLLLVAWYRAASFLCLINKADIFLRKSILVLDQNKFEEDAKNIREDQRPKYQDWKIETFVFIAIIVLVFTLIPVVGSAAIQGQSSNFVNVGIAGLLGGVGFLWKLVKTRVDILNLECDYVDNLVNIVKSDQTALNNIPE